MFCKNIFTNKIHFKIYETIIIILLKALQIVTSRMSSVLNWIVTGSVTLRYYCLLAEAKTPILPHMLASNFHSWNESQGNCVLLGSKQVTMNPLVYFLYDKASKRSFLEL